jgi:hypothetical protein
VISLQGRFPFNIYCFIVGDLAKIAGISEPEVFPDHVQLAIQKWGYDVSCFRYCIMKGG